MKKVLFLCTANSCRSQMAEGFARSRGDILAFSAGTHKSQVNPYAIKVMKELGIEMSDHFSKTIEDLSAHDFDYVFTVCSSAKENCPYLPGAKNIHVGFDDPPHLARDLESEEEVLEVYRAVRDKIKIFIDSLETYMDEEY